MALDPQRSRQRIIKLLENPPVLNFDAQNQHLKLIEPGLERPDADTERSEFTQKFSAAPLIEELRTILRLGTVKLKYGMQNRAEWQRYFRFAGERIVKDGSGGRLVQATSDPENTNRWINWSEESARTWFVKTLLPSLNGKEGATTYILGEPGAGKSTLIKYLINTHAPLLARRSVVFSRFEFLKYYNRWFKKISGSSEVSLQSYISSILFRDLLLSLQYSHRDDGSIERVEIGPFTPAAICNTLRDAAKMSGLGKRDDTDWFSSIAEVIAAASGRYEMNNVMLGSIGHVERVMIINFLVQTRGIELALIIDGLDCVSIEDKVLNTDRAQAAKEITQRAESLTSFVFWEQGQRLLEIPASRIFVMRPSTFFFYTEFQDMERTKPARFYVKEIDARVAMYNAITRMTDKWMARGTQSTISSIVRQKLRADLWGATDLAMRSISRPLLINRPQATIFDVFGGNLRTVFSFMERLLDWFLEESITAGIFSPQLGATVESALKFFTSPEARQLIRRRNYRVIEVLLHGREAWFENAIVIDGKQDDPFGSPVGESLRDNPIYMGFAENVFNYHVTRHSPLGDHHALLEKIRIIQILHRTRTRMKREEIQDSLFGEIGYESPNLGHALVVLVRSELIQVHCDERQELRFSSTRKGWMMVTSLARNLSYLEHVFHRTRFPEPLVSQIRDRIRRRGTEAWASTSIRNLFVFLTYLKYVEDHKARGRSVSPALRIFELTSESSIATARRILWPRHEETGDARWDRIAVAAERHIDNICSQWKRLGLIDPGEALL